MKKLFLLSGLGADKRVFDFLDFGEHRLHHVAWIQPRPDDSLSSYAQRLLPQITEENATLIGVSFGGMIALEIAKLIPVQKVILISSATSVAAIPTSFKVMAKLGMQRLLSPSLLKKPNEMLYWLFGVTDNKHKALLAAIMNDTDEIFLAWALTSIAAWKNNYYANHIVQIHGTHDRILSFQSADYRIEGGGHLMVVTRANEVSAILKIILQD